MTIERSEKDNYSLIANVFFDTFDSKSNNKVEITKASPEIVSALEQVWSKVAKERGLEDILINGKKPAEIINNHAQNIQQSHTSIPPVVAKDPENEPGLGRRFT